MDDMKIEMLNVGWISTSAALWRRGENPERRIRFPVPAYVVEAGKERILIDTGLSPDAIEDPGRHYGQPEVLDQFGLELERSVAEQVDLDALTKVILTHLHFDHAGGLALVPDSVPVYVQRREWKAAHDEAAIARNFLHPRDYAELDREIVLLDGDHDLLGDGSFELLSTPGHTAGHQSVRLREQLIVGADVAHFASSLEDHRFPVFADDFEAQKRSAERLLGLREAGARVLPGHDPDVLRPGAVFP